MKWMREDDDRMYVPAKPIYDDRLSCSQCILPYMTGWTAQYLTMLRRGARCKLLYYRKECQKPAVALRMNPGIGLMLSVLRTICQSSGQRMCFNECVLLTLSSRIMSATVASVLNHVRSPISHSIILIGISSTHQLSG